MEQAGSLEGTERRARTLGIVKGMLSNLGGGAALGGTETLGLRGGLMPPYEGRVTDWVTNFNAAWLR